MIFIGRGIVVLLLIISYATLGLLKMFLKWPIPGIFMHGKGGSES